MSSEKAGRSDRVLIGRDRVSIDEQSFDVGVLP
jgi:hypothetical protein